MPWTATLPDGFWLGCDDERAYAAGAFALWFADTHGPNRMAPLYAALAASTLAWCDSYGTLETVAGEVFGWVYDRFARDFWTQACDPVRNLDLDRALGVQSGGPHPRAALASFDGVTVREAVARPALSSIRYTADVDVGFWPTVLGRDLVARAPAIAQGASVLVYGDPVCPTSGLAGLVELGRLAADARGKTIGRGGDYPAIGSCSSTPRRATRATSRPNWPPRNSTGSRRIAARRRAAARSRSWAAGSAAAHPRCTSAASP